jgi:peroxiredoxin Q/BCP
MIGIMQRGDTVNDFTLEDQHGRMVTLSKLLESGPVVLYFYVKAKTSG